MVTTDHVQAETSKHLDRVNNIRLAISKAQRDKTDTAEAFKALDEELKWAPPALTPYAVPMSSSMPNQNPTLDANPGPGVVSVGNASEPVLAHTPGVLSFGIQMANPNATDPSAAKATADAKKAAEDSKKAADSAKK